MFPTIFIFMFFTLIFFEEKNFKDLATIHTINRHPKGDELFSFELSTEGQAAATFSTPKTYLYEPNAAVMKSGAFKLISEKFKLNKLDQHTHLYTSDDKIAKFPGKVYEISNSYLYQKKPLKKAIGGLKANVKTRNFSEKTETLKTHFKLTDGGDLYLFFTTSNDKKIVVEGRLNTFWNLQGS